MKEIEKEEEQVIPVIKDSEVLALFCLLFRHLSRPFRRK